MKRQSVFALILVATLIVASTPTQAALTFRDVPTNAWYAESVRYVSESGIMSGVRSDEFNPNGTVTRGMIVTVLHRVEGTPTASGNSSFQDVTKGTYYEEAVVWAAESGIANGYSATQFGPNDSITREQLATILYRYAIAKKFNVSDSTDLSHFFDYVQISAYAKCAMQWANAAGLLTGTSEGTLSPKDTATRAQFATIMMRFCKTVLSTQTEAKNRVVEKDSNQEGFKPKEINSTIADSNFPTITVGNVNANVGDTNIQVVVSIKNNPGILGMSLTLTYDESEMTLETAANGAVLKSYLTMTKSKTLSSGCNFIWDGVDVSSEDIADGEILVLTFRIKDTAASGTYPISLSHQICSIVDNNLAPINVSIVNGSITVSK